MIPANPSTILTTCQRSIRFNDIAYEQFPACLGTVSDLPSKTAQRWAERDRSWGARQGAVGDPSRGWIESGLADGIDESRKRHHEYLKGNKEMGGKEKGEGA